jgi:Na+-driven multidrug efflux pump
MSNRGPGTATAGGRIVPPPSILGMSAPIILSFWMRSLFTFVDTAYAATLGDEAVAAVGLSLPLEFFMIACWVGVSTGLTSHLSRAMGARQGARIEQLLALTRRIVWCLVPAFLALAVAVWFGAVRMGLEEEVARMFAVYGAVLVGGSALTSFWSILPDSLVKAHQDTRTTMWAGIWSNIINVTLNTLFLFVFHWGVFGIALSTVLGRFGGLIYALRKAARHEAARKASWLDTNPALDPAPLRSIMSLAVPAALTYALMALESSLVNWLLSTQPEATSSIAAYGIYYRVLLFAAMPIIACSVATLPYVARRFGEGDIDSIRRGIRQVSLIAAVYCVVIVAPAIVLFGPALAHMLAESAVTADLTRGALLLAPLACLAFIPFQLYRPAFEGLHRGRPGLVVAIIRYLILTAPCGLLGMLGAGRLGIPALFGLLVGLIVASALTSGIFMIWYGRTLQEVERALRDDRIRSSREPDPAPAP